MRHRPRAFVFAISAAAVLITVPELYAAGAELNPAPREKDWADLAKLPDWSGVWTPNTRDQDARIERGGSEEGR